ncbi:MAG: T9SS type A sorting domain-containing protein [Bacteroidia bacterium]|nr:T9SS type A sorting domain-containing protein [Bacteroidia bacterium]
MKKSFLLFLLLYSSFLYAQFAPESDPHRGMYIDQFVKTPLNSSSVIDPDFSVLGVDENFDGLFEREDAILKYAAENHITYIALFDLHRVLGRNLTAWDENLQRSVNLEEHLCRFMKKAKSKYGLTQIGAIGGSETFFDSLLSYMNRFPEADFDVVNIEFEFWLDCAVEFPQYVTILNAMDAMKNTYNQTHAANAIISEVYLAALFYCNSSFGSPSVAETIDGCKACSPCAGCPNPHPRKADRILYAWYVSYPGSMNIAEQNIFELSTTEDATDLHPILYSESYGTGGTINFTGIWFPLAPANNIFTAEESYYHSWKNNSGVAHGTLRQNNVQAGGVHWFTASHMVGHLERPQVLQNTGPYCAASSPTQIIFNYHGPIESGIAYQFWVTRDSDSATVYPVAGGKVNGVSGIYQAFTSTTSQIKNINFLDTLQFSKCKLPAGEYTAHLLLNYEDGTGKSYQCDNAVIIAAQPRVEINGPDSFCEGSYTYLRTNNTGGIITWYRNGVAIPGTSANLLVTVDGDYSCMITGGQGCTGMSDTVHIHALPAPEIIVNAVCNGNGTATLKTNLLDVQSMTTPSGLAGATYRWNTGDTTDQITVTPPTSNTTYRVDVTNPYSGCVRYGRITLQSPLVAAYPASITVDSLPSSPCTSDGGLTATISAGGAPTSYLWSTGATTKTISNLPPGKYTVAMNVWTSGCTSYDSVTIGTAPLNEPIVLPIIQHVTCSGGNDGSIQLNISGGNPPFNYFWEYFPDDSVHSPFDKDQSSLYAGIYKLRITDAGGCHFYHTFTVSFIHASPYVESFSTTSVTGCASASNGSATVVAAGGTPPYSYLWNDALQQTSSTATGLLAGAVLMTLSDANGCQSKEHVQISSIELPMHLELLDSSQSMESCVGVQDASLFLRIHGGEAPYIVSGPWQADSNFAMMENLASGIYPIVIIDATGCMFSDSFYIDTPEQIQVFASSTIPSCLGCTNGSFNVSFSGGKAPYQITWQPSVGSLSGTRIQNLPTGVYSICVTDANNCMTCIQDTVFENPSGISSLDINSIMEVYPNPFSKTATISLTEGTMDSGTLVLSSMDGKVVLKQNISSTTTVLFTEELNPGVYFLRLYDEEDHFTRGVKKLIKID